MTHPKPLRAAPACLLLAPIVAGCGGASPAPEAPAARVEDMSTVEGAAAAVDRAEHALDNLLPRQSNTLAQQAGVASPSGYATPPPAASAAPAAPPPPPPPPAEARPEILREAQHDAGTAKKSAAPSTPASPATALDACSTACSALASMARAADHLCSLAGAGDARCTSARTRVTAASARVHASCPACGG
jgi:type IV secretory pathway VirB10-like protein